MEKELKTIALQFEDSKQDFKILFAEVLDPAATVTMITIQNKTVDQFLQTLDNVLWLCFPDDGDLGVLEKEALNGLMSIHCENLTVKSNTENIPKDEIAEALNKIKATRLRYGRLVD